MSILFRALPDNARSKFSKIEQTADQFRQTQSFAFNRTQEIRKIFSMNASIDAAERRQLEAELKDHEATLRDAVEHHRAAAASYTHVRNWIEKLAANLPTTRSLEDAPKVKVPLEKGEGLKACLERLRKEIIGVKTVQHKTMLAPLPPEDMKHHAVAYVAQMASNAKLQPSMKDGQLSVSFFGGSIPTAIPPAAAFALLCAFDPKRAVGCLTEAIDAMPQSHVPSLSQADKDQRLADLAAQLDVLERQEEACVLALHKEGSINVTRRADASPMAVLGIQWKRAVKATGLKPVPRRTDTANGNGNGNGNGEHDEHEDAADHQRAKRKKRKKRRDALRVSRPTAEDRARH